jgi:hypothetical protein
VYYGTSPSTGTPEIRLYRDREVMRRGAGCQRYKASSYRYDREEVINSGGSPSFDVRLETPASCEGFSPQRYSGEVGLAALVTSPALLTLCWSRRSARVNSLPHSHPKCGLSEYQTERGPPSTIRSPHSSHTRMTLLEEPFIYQPPLLWRPTDNLAHSRGDYNVNLFGVDASSGSPTLHEAQV